MVIVTDISEQSSTTYFYDVFLSFRGTDTRYNFTDHLHKALLDATIDTFLDDSDIQTGEDLKPELERAIKTSRASIIVLSKDYASSTWCLDELVLILEQHRTSKHMVFPIFYNVNPTDVRNHQNSYGDAMENHKQRINKETNVEKRRRLAQKMEKWEKALTEVADIKGEEANSRRESMLIEGIVKEISNIIDIQKRSKIPKLFGVKSLVRKITSFLKDESSDTVKILTLWGMAGIGKTSLAKYIFNLQYPRYERSSFIEDIERRCTQPNALLDLQKQLLKDVQDRCWMDTHNTDVGTFKIEKSLFRKRTFLVLDGIDKVEQLDVLIGTKGLHPGSTIIITSKNGSLTERFGWFENRVPPKHMKHLHQGLGVKGSLKLLNSHAFGHNYPNEGNQKELMEVVKYCQGHPLALKVLGGSIHSKEATWEDILESLGKEVDPNIQKVLQIGYNSLPHEKDKELFKFIACLFVREDREFIEEILKACGICRSFGIKNLTDRCLLTIGPSGELEMHQLLQDMGREIVRQESPEKPWKRSLLWHHEDSLNVLQHGKGTIKVLGLVLDMNTFDNETLHARGGTKQTHTFSKMCNLRILRLNYVQFNLSYKDFPTGIRWLCMHGFRLSCIPSDIQMDNMVSLDMSNSKIQQLWKKPKLLRSLKYLNLSCCRELVSVGHLSGIPLLETLMLVGCISLTEICETIGSCDRLVLLNLSECKKLKKLPRSIGKLKKLRKLSTNGCTDLGEFPSEIKDLASLEVLEADNMNMEPKASSSAIVEAIPRTPKSFVIFLPNSIVCLSLKGNNLSSESFPKDFGNLPMLKDLYLDNNPVDSLPDCIRSLSRLEFLSLEYCHKLKTILCTPQTINSLVVSDCCSLEKITFHPDKPALPEVYYGEIYSLTEIQHKFKLQAIAEVDEEILHSLGWINLDYVKCHNLSIAGFGGQYKYIGRELPAQMLYENGIFSTYLQGKEVLKLFTHRSNGASSITLKSSTKNSKIRGLTLCIVSTIPSTTEVGPLRITIRNLSKNCSWIYQPLIYVVPEVNEEEIVWLSHWMFGNNEFEDGDEVCVHDSVKFYYEKHIDSKYYGGQGPRYAHVREYGINLEYDDGNKKEDHLSYYKSWKHIIGRDLSAAKLYSGDYLLRPDWTYVGYSQYQEEPDTLIGHKRSFSSYQDESHMPTQ